MSLFNPLESIVPCLIVDIGFSVVYPLLFTGLLPFSSLSDLNGLTDLFGAATAFFLANAV